MQALVSLYQWKNGMVVQGLALRRAHLQHQHRQPGGQHRRGGPHRADVALDGPHPALRHGPLAFYMNRTVYSILRLQALNKSANAITVEKGLNQFGTPQSWSAFEGTPLRRCDQLLNTEARVV
jgi:hypothetical protein